MAAIITRAQWGARHRNGVGSRPTGSLRKFTHHTVTAHLSANASRTQEERQMRILEDIGQQRFGGGISYNFLIFPSGRIYEGASVGRISYHSGSGRNTSGVGIAFVGNFEANKLNMKAFNAAVWLLQHGVERSWWGDPAFTEYHKKFRATSCPGRYVINDWSKMNAAGRGGSIAPPSGVTGTAPRDTSTKRINIDTIMQTSQDKVHIRTHRNQDDDDNIVHTMHNAGYNVHVLYREGSWARVQRGGKHWVPWAHLEESDVVWPNIALPVTDSHTTASHNAWVKLMADVGYTDRRLTTAIQKWLRGLGYYKGRLDGSFGPMTVRALQSFLRTKGLYKGRIDGQRGPMTIRAEIDYLNSQRQHY